MRLGVLDVGSTTVRLLMVGVDGGGHPTAAAVEAVQICPWSLREGVILRRPDRPAVQP